MLATAEECTCHRTYTVTKKGLIKAGICKEILIDDRREILVVSEMLSEYNECNGDVSNCNGCKVADFKVLMKN